MKATKEQAIEMIEKLSFKQLAAAIELMKKQPEKFSDEFIQVCEMALASK